MKKKNKKRKTTDSMKCDNMRACLNKIYISTTSK